jgi:hypothetical protein
LAIGQEIIINNPTSKKYNLDSNNKLTYCTFHQNEKVPAKIRGERVKEKANGNWLFDTTSS